MLFCKHLGVGEQILAVARERREVLIDYLVREGLADGTKSALCDVGWRGTMQLCIARITANCSEFPREFKGFYFGLHRRNLFVQIDRTETFYAGDAGFVSKLGWLVEAFCATEHGTLETFSRDKAGVVVPVLPERQDSDQIDWGCIVQRAAIIRFVNDLAHRLSLAGVFDGQVIEVLRHKAMAAFELMRTRPSLEEADAYGSILVAYDVAHKHKFVVGPILRPDRLLLWLALRQRSRVVRPWCWSEGSIRRSVSSSWLRPIFHAVHSSRKLWDGFRGRPDF